MKKAISLLAIAILSFSTLFSCEDKELYVPVVSVTLSQPAAEMMIGESITLSASISPSNSTEQDIIWASSKLSVATVDQNGKVVAVAEGMSTITATAGGKVGSCMITISKGIVEVSSVSLDKTSASLKVGETVTLIATVKPDDATDKSVSWTSSDNTVATIKDGTVTALAVGVSTIEVHAGDKSASCAVTVEESQYSIADIFQLEDGADILTAPLLVVAKATRGYMVSDETGNLFVYGAADSKQVDVGDVVQFRAKKTTYRNLPELANLYDLVKLSTGNTITYPTPSELPNVEEVDLNVAPFNTFTYCKAEGMLTHVITQSNGISYRIEPGNSTSLGKHYTFYLFYPYDYQSDSDFYKSIEGRIINGRIVDEKVHFEGYFLGLNTSNGELNFMPTSIRVQPEGSMDLGLSVYWAVSNLSESGLCDNITDYGDYYAWGETEPYYRKLDPLTWKKGKGSGYSWVSYKWCNGSDATLTKYNTDNSHGAVDGKTVLETSDDPAHVKLGGRWRMPTVDEWLELLNKCSVYSYTLYGVSGKLFIDDNGNSIFIPEAGRFLGSSLVDSYVGGQYWSSSLAPQDAASAYSVELFRAGFDVTGIQRCYGLSIRPVADK